jgi:hypothetical protein
MKFIQVNAFSVDKAYYDENDETKKCLINVNYIVDIKQIYKQFVQITTTNSTRVVKDSYDKIIEGMIRL